MRTNLFLLAIIMIAQSCETSSSKLKKDDTSLVGSWKFLADQEVDDNNQVKNEDTDVDGLLIYTSNGKMSVQLAWQGRRASIMNDTIMNQDGISFGVGLGDNRWALEVTRKIIDTYDAYFGDYKIDWKSKIVTHTIEGNLRPEREGTSYRRAFRFNGDTLFLKSTDPKMRWQTKWVKIKE